MNFNSLSRVPPERRKLFIIIAVILFVPFTILGLLYIIIPYLKQSSTLTDYSNTELIATLAVGVAIITIASKIIEHVIYSQYSSKRKIEIDISTTDDYVTITCTIENRGSHRIVPQNVYLFIDEGVETDNIITFPFCLKHEEGKNDCVLGIKCKSGGVNSFPIDILPDNFRNKYHKMVNLKHLSTESVKFIDPGERFSEDATLRTPHNGVFRVMAIWTSVNADCLCCTKQFVISTETQHNQTPTATSS